jgi:poly-gamma-glutamate capsule biosynthesis protein CapA/YwtB (metallophosphatase superfamily)
VREPVTTLTVVGDIMLGRGVADQPGGAVARLEPMSQHLRAADLTVGNLESTLSGNGTPQQGADSFRASPAVLRALAGAGVDAVSLANNHTGDYGERALLETVAAFQGRRVHPFGAGRDLRAATRPAVLTRNGVRFGFLGFNAIGETPRATVRAPGALSVRMPPRTGPLNRADLAHVLRAVRALADRVDVVVVLPHWGAQYTHVAGPVQSLVGRRLVEAGADLVVGGHPHWVQGLERHAGGVVAHSLGNFVFDMDFMEQTMEGVTLTARFRGDRLRGVRLTPYRLDGTFTPRRVTGPAAAAILRDVRTH